MGINEKEIEKIKEYLKEKLAPYLIILFGSAVKGYMREDSDVDIAFLSDKELNSYEVFLIAQGLADLLGRDVDLVDLKKASTVFQVQVISTGKVIFCSDKTKRMVFEMTALKKYARLNEERECILEKIKERGSIYGK